MTELQQTLLARYLAIINEQGNQAFLNTALKAEEVAHLFLTFVPDDYDINQENILVVGRETKGWMSGVKFEKYDQNAIEKCLSASNNHYQKEMKNGNVGGFTFWDFMRNLQKQYKKGTVLWGNIYAMSYKKNSPKKWDHFKALEKLSGELLKAAIEILKPKVVLLACGQIKTREVYFPKVKIKTDMEIKQQYKQYPIRNLWKFHFDEYDFCDFYRINHPASRFKNADLHNEIRKALIDHLSK